MAPLHRNILFFLIVGFLGRAAYLSRSIGDLFWIALIFSLSFQQYLKGGYDWTKHEKPRMKTTKKTIYTYVVVGVGLLAFWKFTIIKR